MQGASTFTYDAEQSRTRLEKARGEYLSQRDQLHEAHQEVQSLRDTLSSSRRQARLASQQAEDAIRAAKGHETAEAVEMQEMAIRKERQITVLEKMIADQAPGLELLQIDAYGARIAYERSLSDARHAALHDEIKEQATALFSSDAAAPLMRLLPDLMRRVERDVYADPGRMAAFGLDATSAAGRGASTAPYLTNDQQKEISREIRTQQMAAIGELVSGHIEMPEVDVLSELDNIFASLELLDCESDGGKWNHSGIAVSRRRKELVALLGEPAA